MKTKLLALLLSVAVTFSGIPATNVLAAPAETETIVEVEAATVEEVETSVEEATEESFVEETLEEANETVVEDFTAEETASEETTVEETTSEETSEEAIEETTTEVVIVEESAIEKDSGVVSAENTSAKVVGTNGVAYNGVAYLSSKTFNSLPQEVQLAYIQICDSIAEQMESGLEVKNAVISVDAEGNLGLTASIPAQTIFSFNSQNVITAENMELANTVKVAEESVADAISAEELNTLITNENYFRNQITDKFSLKLYDAGKKSMVKGGSNTIKLNNYVGLIEDWEPICDAISALVTTYPNKFNWVDWANGGLSMNILYRRSGSRYICNYTYTLGKSKHYSKSLETAANKKVKELVEEAYAYAETSYPNAPTYGIIKYFNTWICQNNYYEYNGVETEMYGHTKEYYYCHSCYGILLKGYGVCESYALAMSRLLDAAGIRNIYVVGDAGGGHAWNYVEMPNGKWYMVDSTWNDIGASASTEYLLCSDDGVHTEQGARWAMGRIFGYPNLASAAYSEGTSESITINNSKAFLKPNATMKLKVDAAANATDYYSKYTKTWTSSDTKVAKVDKNGKVTAKAPGKAVISCKIAGRVVSCTVYVYKLTGLKFTANNKSAYTLNYPNPDETFSDADIQTITLTAEQQNKVLTAQELMSNVEMTLSAKSSKKAIADVKSVSISGDTVTLKVSPKKIGSTNITVTLGGKKATLTVKVSQQIDASWFDFSKVTNVEYNGKAFKPAVKLSDAGKAVSPKPTFKVTYTNNKNAGTATVTVTGTGSYGGTVSRQFTINKKDASAATFNKCTASKTYNGKAQTPATTVKLGSVVLKAGTDYDVLYNGSTTAPTQVGTYIVSIRTKGNYKTVTLAETKTFEIKANKIANVKVTCPTTVKVGNTLNYKVKIGANELPTSDYTVSYTDNAGNPVAAATVFATPGKYKLVITVKGSNILPTATKSSITKAFTVKAN